MRIAFDAKRYFKNRTGLGNFSRELVHALAVSYPDDEFILFSETQEKPLLDVPNLRVFSPKTARKFWRFRGVSRDAQKLGVDVYHGLSNEIPLGLQKANIRTVVTIHDVIFKRFPGFYPVIDRWVYQKKTQFALKHADAVAVTSAATAKDLNAYYGFPEDKSHVIYQPVQSLFYVKSQGTIRDEQPYFIYVSGFSSRKNHAALIEAFAHIKSICDWNLILAGSSGNTLDSVRRFVDYERLGQRVRIVTDLEIQDLVHLMQRASAFVYPSLYEGFGIPMAEAAVCGLPMAVSDIPVFREIAGDAALYFHPNHTREMADAMLRLTNPEHTSAMAAHRSEILRKIEPKRIAEQYMQLYRN